MEISGAKDSRFQDVLKEMGAMYDRKTRDYGTESDPLANLRASNEWGIAPWLGALVRLNDKIVRLKSYAKTGKLANEGVEDSILDVACYSVLALILFRESTDAPRHSQHPS